MGKEEDAIEKVKGYMEKVERKIKEVVE